MPQRTARTHHHLRWLAFAVLLLFPITGSAGTITLNDYYDKVRRAVVALDTLQQSDEAEEPSAYEVRFEKTLRAVAEALPEHETVQTAEGPCNVDNSWLHAALKDLKGAAAEQRETKLSQILERLRAVEERVKPGEVTPATDKAQTKAKLESVLRRPEYETKAREESALSRLLLQFIRWLQELLPQRVRMQPGGSRWMTVLAQWLVVLVALSVLFYIARLLLARYKPKHRRRAPKKREARIVLGERLAPEDTAVDLLAEAEALARRGDVRGAIRKAYIALLVELGDRKVITLAQHKTNRDYLNAVRNLPPLHQTMRGLTDSFERHWYGLVDASDNDWQNFRAGYRSALQT